MTTSGGGKGHRISGNTAGPELVSKPAISSENMSGGATVVRLVRTFVCVCGSLAARCRVTGHVSRPVESFVPEHKNFCNTQAVFFARIRMRA